MDGTLDVMSVFVLKIFLLSDLSNNYDFFFFLGGAIIIHKKIN